MSTEDLTNALTDTLDTLRTLATVCAGTNQQQALRVNTGRLLTMLREQLDDLDYAYTLFVCELSPVTAEHYKRIYMASMLERMEAEA